MNIFGVSIQRAQPPEPVAIQVDNALALLSNQSSDSIRQRVAALASGGYDFADTLHNVFLDYGYPQQLEFLNFWNMYRRFGIAKNVVEMVPDTGWLTTPQIVASEKFVNELDLLAERIDLWHRLKGLDIRQRVGRYAGLFMRVKDGKKPHEPLVGGLPGQGALVDITPLYESQLIVTETETDPTSENFGLPKMYEFRSGTEGDRDARTQASFNIHPSRIVVAAEGADSTSIFGISALEAGYNSLMDLRKIIGAGGEGFYKNAAQSIVFDLKDAASASQNKELLEQFNINYDEFARNRFRRGLWTPGMEATVLESHLINPKEFFSNALNDVAASVPIPATVLIGQQTGRLASDEDARVFLSSVQSRRNNFMSSLVTDVLDWFIANGILQTAEYTVEWDDLLALSDKDRLDNVDKMAGANEKQFKSGGQPIFSAEEIREASGFEFKTEPPPLPDETLDDETLDDETPDDEEQTNG